MAYAFVVCVKINNEELVFLMLSWFKIHMILVLDRLRCGNLSSVDIISTVNL